MGRSLLPSVSAHQAQHFAVSHPSRLPPCQLVSWRQLPVASDEIPWRRAPALGGSHGRCRAGTEKGNASALAFVSGQKPSCILGRNVIEFKMGEDR